MNGDAQIRASCRLKGGELERTLRFLLDPASYGAQRIEAVETHMSWVFLTEGEAFKLKKPVRLDGVDFMTLEARRHACREEVRLNRRLAPDVYRGLTTLVEGPGGALRFEGEDAPGAVEHLIRMRRLPADRLLDGAIEQATVTTGDIDRVADLLSLFYSSNRAPSVRALDLIGRLRDLIDRSETELSAFPQEIDERSVARTAEALRRALLEHAENLRSRVDAGRVVEGHGDLRPEHVFLGPPACVIDCLEFDRRLRLLDWAEEASFLALECERLGAAWIGGQIIARCSERLGDAPPSPLLAFYRSVHAFGRARIAIRHLRDEVVREPAKWPRLASRYLELCAPHLAPA